MVTKLDGLSWEEYKPQALELQNLHPHITQIVSDCLAHLRNLRNLWMKDQNLTLLPASLSMAIPLGFRTDGRVGPKRRHVRQW